MTLDNFERKIDPVILRRGKSYWQSGAVSDIYRDSANSISAEVEGSDLYDVEISFQGDKIESCSCTCPYDWSPYCKHIVAVFYELSDRDNLEDIPGDPELEDIEKAKKLIGALSDRDLREILQSQVEENSRLRNWILARYAQSQGSDEGSTYYEKIIEDSLEPLTDRMGFIGYREARYAADEANNLLEMAEQDIQDGEYETAFSMVRAVMGKMIELWPNIDDSNGNVGGCIQSAMDILKTMAQEKLPEKMREILLEYLLNEELLDELSDVSWNWDLLNIAANMIDEDEEERRILSVGENQCRSGTGYGVTYDAEQYALLKLDILKNHHSPEEADRFLWENIRHSRFRVMILYRLMEEKKHREVLRVAEEGIVQDRNTAPGLVSNWYEWILKASEEAGYEGTYRDAAESYYLISPGLKRYRQLKKSFSAAEWAEKLDRLKTKIKENTYHYREVLIEEGLIDELWESVSPRFTLEIAERYGEHLYPRYHERMMIALGKIIPGMLDSIKDRNFYRRISTVLFDLAEAGESERANILVKQLLISFKNRRALKDELYQRGFEI